MRILYARGADASIGDKPIAAVELLGEEPRGAFYGGYLFPVEYALQLVPALRAGQLGSSFRFRVVREHVDDRPPRSDFNPERLPRRTLLQVTVFELGPCPFPAYHATSAGIRAGTPPRSRPKPPAISRDEFIRQISSGPGVR